MQIRPASHEAMQLFMEGQIAFSRMEQNGMRVDIPRLEQSVTDTENKIKELDHEIKKSEIWDEWKKRFRGKANLTSLPQLAEVLFDGLKIPYPDKERTATGRYKSDDATLAKVDHPFVTAYRTVGDQRSILAVLNRIKRETYKGIIRPSFNLASGEDDVGGGARSYRSSSSDPNAQNFPNRNPIMAAIIRPLFVPFPGEHWGEFDFSGVEVKIACCVTKDPRLISEFTEPGKDPHGDTALELFLMTKEIRDRDKDRFKKTVRDSAKNQFVFPQFFGSVWFQCAPAIWQRMLNDQWKMPGSDQLVIDHLKSKGITRLGSTDPKDEPSPEDFTYVVKNVEHGFWNKRFKVYTQWKKDLYQKYLKEGHVIAPTGFVASDVMKRNQVLNFPIQGPAYHCQLWCNIQLQKEIDKYRMRTRITSQIHDSLNLSIPPNEREDILYLTEDIMTRRLVKHWSWLIVPMEIEAELSPVDGSWYEKKLVFPRTPPEGKDHLTWLAKDKQWIWK